MMEGRFAAAGHADPGELDLYQRTVGTRTIYMREGHPL